MRADDLEKRFQMIDHVENGKFLEHQYDKKGDGRQASGSIYYYISPGEHTKFHRIDCDEYWVYNAGETAELYIIDFDGKLIIKKCGVLDDAEPIVKIEKGQMFAARLSKDADDGFFTTCITVPDFEMGFRSPEEYEKAACNVVYNPSVLHKNEKEDGDDVYYIEDTNEFVIVSSDGYIRTYFNPSSGIDYYNRQ